MLGRCKTIVFILRLEASFEMHLLRIFFLVQPYRMQSQSQSKDLKVQFDVSKSFEYITPKDGRYTTRAGSREITFNRYKFDSGSFSNGDTLKYNFDTLSGKSYEPVDLEIQNMSVTVRVPGTEAIDEDTLMDIFGF